MDYMNLAWMDMKPWIGVDLDGTLAEYHNDFDKFNIGKPIPLMVERVKQWIKSGKKVKIFTARVCHREGDELLQIKEAIRRWLVDAGLPETLEITCEKDFGMVELWDDRCVQVISNTGVSVR
jgi:hypothetical protein